MAQFRLGRRLVLGLLVGLIVCLSAVQTAFAETEQEGRVYRLGDRILTLGSWGADVFELQLELNRAGYDVVADGLFGRQTQLAVLSLQVASGLEPDGIVGPATLAALRSQFGTMEYVVQPGDSLWVIARRFDTTMDEIVALNRLTTSVLQVGQRLQVPAPRTYIVQEGDTLSAIAVRFQTTVQALAALNDIRDPNRIRVGMELRLPR